MADRNPPPDKVVHAIMDIIRSRTERQIAIEKEANFTWDMRGRNLTGVQLRGAWLPGADFEGVNLSGARLREINLSGAELQRANLSGAMLRYADLSGADLQRANLSGANLWQANLSGALLWNADFSGALLRGANLSGAELCRVQGPLPAEETSATGLTQEQLDEACAHPDNPPELAGVRDAETGKPLVWRGKPLWMPVLPGPAGTTARGPLRPSPASGKMVWRNITNTLRRAFKAVP